ncbi:MAG: site-2 protease family protein [Vulcanimicrobiota bacterium]
MDPLSIVIGVCCIMFALLIHEYAHAFMSYQLGDPTAKYQGRLSLNPIVHFDPVGAICLVVSFVSTGGGAIMGWAKAVPIDPDNFKNRALDTALVAAAGPFINLLVAAVCSILIITGLVLGTPLYIIVRTLLVANVGFAIFNLIPWPPLDGWKILGAVVGRSASRKMEDLEQKLGMYSLVGLLLIVAVFGPLFLYPLNRAVLSIFLGGY